MRLRYRPLLSSLACLALTATLAGPTLAKRAPDPRPDAPLPPSDMLVPEFRIEATVARGHMRVGVESGVPRTLAHVGYPVTPGDPETMAREYLRANAGLLRLEPTLGDLSVRATRAGRAATVVRFEQRYRGLPVLASDIAVSIDAAPRVIYVANGYEPGVTLESIVPAVAEEAARAAALGHLAVEGPLAHEVTRLAVLPAGKDSRLVWQVRVVPAQKPSGDWEVLVDAKSGQFLRLTDFACYLNGSGQVFDPDPLGTGHATYGDPGYTDGADAATPQLDAARSTRTLLDITEGGGLYKLQGPYAQIVDTETPFKGLFIQGTSTFDFDRAADAFEAAHTYFHVDHVMRYLNVTLGIPVMPTQYSGGVHFDPSGLNGDDNSHYTPSTGVIAFGEGGVDDAEDADVVIHELGHGLHDWLTSGNLSQVNGLSEGTGDYYCQSYSRSLGQWASNEAPFQWTFSWDGHNEFWSGRITNYGAHYPDGLVGQIHTDGQIWATSLMKIWDDLGRDLTDAAVSEGLAMTNSSSSQDDAAQAVVQAAIAMNYTTGQMTSIITHFQATGYDVSFGVDYVGSGTTDVCASNPSQQNGVIEPGETVTIPVTIQAASLAQTGVTGVLSTATPGVTLLDNTATWPNLAAGVPTVSDAPHFRVQLAPTVECLTDVGFDLAITSNEGGPYPMAFSVPVGATLTPSGLPLSVPDADLTGATSTLAVGANLVLTDVNVRVQMTHTWVGDLFIKIRSPLGTEVTLLDRPGVPASTYGCNNDNMNVTFDDAGAIVPETYCAGSNPWLTGPALPVGALSAFNGQSSQGNWILTVSDRAGGDVGSVTAWELLTSPALEGTCDTCVTLVGVPIAGNEATFGLGGNRPNPFSGTTDIAFQLSRRGQTSVRVFNVAGRAIATVLDRELGPGPQVATWDGRDESGQRVAPGVYFYRVTSGGETRARSMLLVR